MPGRWRARRSNRSGHDTVAQSSWAWRPCLMHSLPRAGNGSRKLRPQLMDAKTEKPARNADGVRRGMLTSLLGYHLRRAQLAVFQHFAATMGAAEITPGQFRVLTVLSINPRPS